MVEVQNEITAFHKKDQESLRAFKEQKVADGYDERHGADITTVFCPKMENWLETQYSKSVLSLAEA